MTQVLQPGRSGSARADGGEASWIPAMLVGALIFAVGCGGGLVAGWFAGTLSRGLAGFPSAAPAVADLVVVTEQPDSLRVGEPFELVVRVTDTRGDARVVQDIDFSGAICDGFTAGGITPSPQSTSDVPEYREHVFGHALAAGGTAEFRFTLTPTASGTFFGTITVYDANYDSEDVTVTLVVE